MDLISIDLNFLIEKVRKSSAYLTETEWNVNDILYIEGLEQTKA